MTQTTWTIDRIATIVVGLLLIAVGVFGIIWRLDVWAALPHESDTSSVAQWLTSTGWWPWAAGLAGVVLILLALRWLWAHLPGRGVGDLNLPGTGPQGRLRFNAKSAASAAADVLASLPSVQSARGTVKRDRGQLIVDLKVTADPHVSLRDLARDSDRVIADLVHVMGRQDLYGRVHLSVDPAASSGRARVQ